MFELTVFEKINKPTWPSEINTYRNGSTADVKCIKKSLSLQAIMIKLYI